LFLILIYAAIIIRKRQEIRNLIIPIVGLIIPFFVVFTYYFFTDNTGAFNDKLTLYYSFSYVEFSELFTLICLTVLVIFSIVFVSLKIHSLLNDIKASWLLIIIHLLVAVYLIVITPEKDELFLFFPLIIIISNCIQLFNKMLIRELIIVGLLFLSINAYFI